MKSSRLELNYIYWINNVEQYCSFKANNEQKQRMGNLVYKNGLIFVDYFTQTNSTNKVFIPFRFSFNNDDIVLNYYIDSSQKSGVSDKNIDIPIKGNILTGAQISLSENVIFNFRLIKGPLPFEYYTMVNPFFEINMI